MKIIELDNKPAREWTEHELERGLFISAAVLGSSPLNHGMFRTCISDEAALEPLPDFGRGWMAKGREADAWLAQIFNQLAVGGAQCVIAEDNLTTSTDPAYMDTDIRQALIHGHVLCWSDLDSTNGAEAVAETMHIANGYPRNVFVVSRPAAELGLADRQYVPSGFLRKVTKSLLGVIVSIFDDESYLVWTPQESCDASAEPRPPRMDLYFRFYGENFDPDEITKRLGVEPTTSFRPGDPITKDGRGKRRDYGWILEVKGSNPWENDDLLQEFRQRLSVSPEAVRQVCRDFRINPVVICGVGIRDIEAAAPDLYFPREFLNWVTELGASLNVDVI